MLGGMGKMRAIGWVVFVVLAVVGVVVFNDMRARTQAKAEADGLEYFNSIVQEEPTITTNAYSGQPPVHPWKLVKTPSSIEIREHVRFEPTTDGVWKIWVLHPGGVGAKDSQPVTVKGKFDQEDNLEELSGIHGTITRYPTEWQPQAQ